MVVTAIILSVYAFNRDGNADTASFKIVWIKDYFCIVIIKGSVYRCKKVSYRKINGTVCTVNFPGVSSFIIIDGAGKGSARRKNKSCKK